MHFSSLKNLKKQYTYLGHGNATLYTYTVLYIRIKKKIPMNVVDFATKFSQDNTD